MPVLAAGASQEEVYAAGLRAAQEADREHEQRRTNTKKHVDAQTRCEMPGCTDCLGRAMA
jgi:hypothetical protein